VEIRSIRSFASAPAAAFNNNAGGSTVRSLICVERHVFRYVPVNCVNRAYIPRGECERRRRWTTTLEEARGWFCHREGTYRVRGRSVSRSLLARVIRANRRSINNRERKREGRRATKRRAARPISIRYEYDTRSQRWSPVRPHLSSDEGNLASCVLAMRR